jgi:RND family efflux transporter MFP subunit
LFAACGSGTDNPHPPTGKTVAADLVTVMAQAIPETYTTVGTLTANERVDVAARILGEIRNLAVREGQAVTRGQVILTIDATEITNRLNEAQARVAEASAQAEESHSDLERHQKLLAQKAMSERAVEQARLRYEVAREGLSAAEAAATQIRVQLEYTDVRSPVTGVVVTRHKQSGDMATPGAPILTIEDPENIEVNTFVKEGYVDKIGPGDDVQVYIDATEKHVSGTVSRIVPAGDAATYRYLVRIALHDVDGLRAGMFARVEFPAGARTGITIPVSAIVERGDMPGVYLVDNDDIAHFRMVRTGRLLTDHIEIVAGLNAHDRIAVTNTTALRTGFRISPAPPNPVEDVTANPVENSRE